jgi:hypothetical protein
MITGDQKQKAPPDPTEMCLITAYPSEAISVSGRVQPLQVQPVHERHLGRLSTSRGVSRKTSRTSASCESIERLFHVAEEVISKVVSPQKPHPSC